jgi:hypothetical protein
LLSGLSSLQRTRRAVARVGESLEAGRCSLIAEIEPEQFGHPWEDVPRDRTGRSGAMATDR